MARHAVNAFGEQYSNVGPRAAYNMLEARFSVPPLSTSSMCALGEALHLAEGDLGGTRPAACRALLLTSV
jgi:hypothetical protein